MTALLEYLDPFANSSTVWRETLEEEQFGESSKISLLVK